MDEDTERALTVRMSMAPLSDDVSKNAVILLVCKHVCTYTRVLEQGLHSLAIPALHTCGVSLPRQLETDVQEPGE